MREHLEVELKWALADADAHRRLDQELERLLGPPRRLAQDNRFFDASDSRLRRAGYALRLRRENERLVLTCKRREAPAADGLHRHQEWEDEIDTQLWPLVAEGRIEARLLPLPAPVLSALGDAPLAAIGGFANLRLERHRDGEQVCLDRTDFGRRIDHELEVETDVPEPSARFWRERLAAWGIAHRPQADSKLARMMEILKSR